MSDGKPDSAAAPENDATLAEMAGKPAPEKVTYSMSPGLSAFLGANRIGLAISSYQSGKFYLLGQNVNGGLLVDERFFRKAMGICVPDKDTLLLATLFQLIKFRNVLEPDQQVNHVFDTCYVPREIFVTGELDAHDIGQLADGRIVFVNTLYNCLATPSARHSFTPIWKPPFISKIVREDRCHLNGLAMADGVPRYVTAVSKSDTIDGWRDRRFDGGIVIDVTYGEAESVFRKGRYEESAELFGIFVERSPDHAFGHYMLGLSAWKSGDHERAEAALRRAVELNGESVKIRTNLGRVLLERGVPLEAVPHLEAAVEIEPTSHEVWRVLGNTYAGLRRSDDALAAYRQALMLNDHDAWTMNNYGLLMIQLGRYDEAVRPLARAVELVPLSATFQNNLGVALERIGEIEGARQAYAAALAADSTYARARTSLERVEQRLLDTTMEAPDLGTFAREFVDEMQRWIGESEHDC
jgi:Flp pilus assembly protein TadD